MDGWINGIAGFLYHIGSSAFGCLLVAGWICLFVVGY